MTTRHRGVPNVMTNGFTMMVRHDPPLIAATIGPWDHSYEALVETVETVECVVAVPTAELAATVVDIGNCSGTARRGVLRRRRPDRRPQGPHDQAAVPSVGHRRQETRPCPEQ
ncbi:flavin reductase [Streptomyces sp. NPDC050548]|uniref:flavin reductase n=1 Tax=Streptomyces sp. NPDC050548 TaxID=3365629 RepID=UPI0037886278